MSKEKIEEMAKHCPCYFGEKCCIDGELPEKCDMLCQFGTYAEILYNAGYRKQSEGEWIFKEEKDAFFCSLCDQEALIDANCIGIDFAIAELSDFCPHCGAHMKGGA